MTTDRLAALLHEKAVGCTYGYGDAAHAEGHKTHAARLAAAGVTVGLDVERLAAALATMAGFESDFDQRLDSGDYGNLYRPREFAAAIARTYAATPAQPEPSCCELACYEDPGCACEGCAQPAPDALRAAAAAVVEHFADGDGHDVAYRDGEWVCTDDCRAHALLAALRAALGDEHD